LVVMVVAGLSYIGVMPFFSKFVAKQVNLGMKADPALVTAFEAKYGRSNGTGGMTNNILAINPTTLQIGRVTVSESITKLVAGGLGDVIERRISQIGVADIKRYKL